MTETLIALGANLNEKQKHLEHAIRSMELNPEIHELIVSDFFKTAPIGGPASQDFFLNAAARFATDLSARKVLNLLLSIEKSAGRERDVRWQARSLDLDLLIFGNQIVTNSEIEIPHPRMSFRRFVLEPACQIAADMFHPVTKSTLKSLLSRVNQSGNHVLVAGSKLQAYKLFNSSIRELSQNTADLPIELSWLDRDESAAQAIELKPNRFFISRYKETSPIPKLLVVVEKELEPKVVETISQSGGPYLLVDDSNDELAAKELIAALQATLKL